MMTAAKQTDAIDDLRERVRHSRLAAEANPLWSTPVEELRSLVEMPAEERSGSGWSNPYPSSDPRSLLLEYQFPIFHDRSRFKFQLQSRQSGKDFTMQGEAAEDCLARPGTEWMIAAPSERQALDSLDQGKTWAEAFSLVVESYDEQREGLGGETLLKSAEITYSNGSRVRAVPGKPSTVRGRSANIGLTEFDFFENPAETWRAIVPSITNPLKGGEKKVRIVTTPNGRGGAADKIWSKDEVGKTKWSKHLVTIYHAVLMGLPVDVQQLREIFDDPEGWLQEFECQFLDGSSVLLPYELIASCESIDATEAWSLGDAVGGGPRYVGVDFGRENDPTVIWTLQKVGGLLVTREVRVLRGIPSPDQQRILSPIIKDATRTSFDYTGPGIGLGDYIAAEHGEYKPEAHKFGKVDLCVFTVGFKRSIFPRLRQAFERREVLIPISREIREDLHEMQQITTGGEYSYHSKRTREGHSDRCTALALALRAAGTGGGVAIKPTAFQRVAGVFRNRATTREVTA
jgi:phage FluMu gp28-like protein